MTHFNLYLLIHKKFFFYLTLLYLFIFQTNLMLAQDSVSHLNRTIEIDKTDGDAYFSRGYSHFILQRYNKALKDFDMAIKFSKEDALPHYFKAKVLIELNEHHQAIRSLNASLKINPNHVDSLYHLALAKSIVGEYSTAFSIVNKVITSNSNLTKLYKLRGQLHEYYKETNKAINDYQIVLEQTPNDIEVSKRVIQIFLQDEKRNKINLNKGLSLAKNLLTLGQLPEHYDLIARLYAELRQFNLAIQNAQIAYNKSKSLVSKSRLDLFKSGKSELDIILEKKAKKNALEKKKQLERQKRDEIWQEIVAKNNTIRRKK